MVQQGKFLGVIHHKADKTRALIISDKEFASMYFYDIREWFQHAGSEEWNPTKKGVSVPKKHWLEFKNIVLSIDTE